MQFNYIFCVTCVTLLEKLHSISQQMTKPTGAKTKHKGVSPVINTRIAPDLVEEMDGRASSLGMNRREILEIALRLLFSIPPTELQSCQQEARQLADNALVNALKQKVK